MNNERQLGDGLSAPGSIACRSFPPSLTFGETESPAPSGAHIRRTSIKISQAGGFGANPRSNTWEHPDAGKSFEHSTSGPKESLRASHGQFRYFCRSGNNIAFTSGASS